MKKYLLAASFILFGTILALAQEQPIQQQQSAQSKTGPQSIKNNIHSGFYLKVGGSFAVGKFASTSTYYYNYKTYKDTITYYKAKIGPALELGWLIYIGPAFAGNHIRAGIDATFLTMSFNPTDPLLAPDVSASKKLEYYYYFAGQKFGPLLTINPVDYLMIDLSYKLNATAAWYHSMWGSSYTLNEVSLGLRYRVMLFAFQYNWGKVKFTYNQGDNPQYWVDYSTFRIIMGLKF